MGKVGFSCAARSQGIGGSATLRGRGRLARLGRAPSAAVPESRRRSARRAATGAGQRSRASAGRATRESTAARALRCGSARDRGAARAAARAVGAPWLGGRVACADSVHSSGRIPQPCGGVGPWERETTSRFPQYPQEPVYACSGRLRAEGAVKLRASGLRAPSGAGVGRGAAICAIAARLTRAPADLYTSPPLRAPSAGRRLRVVFYFAPVERLPRR